MKTIRSNPNSSHRALATGLKRFLIGSLAAALPFAATRAPAQCAPDVTPPIIDCLADSGVPPSGPDGVILLLPVSAVDNCDPFPVVECDPPSGSLFPIGTTTVDCIATDVSGNFIECSFNITVFAPRTLKIQVRDELVVLRDGATNDLSKFDAAINYLNKSIDPARWFDDSRPNKGKAGEGVFNNEKSALSQMLSLKANHPDVQPLIDALVSIDRLIVEIAIDDAMARNGNASKITAAVNYLNKGDAKVAAGNLTKAIDDYKNAWKNAVAA